MAHHIYCQQFKKALLGNLDKREVGDFVLFKEINDGVRVMTKEAFSVRAQDLKRPEIQDVKRFSRLKQKQKQDKAQSKISPPSFAPITDDELALIEGS